MQAIINYFVRTGARKGLQGSQPWLIVAIIAFTIRLLRKLANPRGETVWRQALQPGDRFEVTVRNAAKK